MISFRKASSADGHALHDLAVVGHFVGQGEQDLIGSGSAIEAPALSLGGPKRHIEDSM